MKKKMIIIVQIMSFMIAVLCTIACALMICGQLLRVCPM